MRVPRPRPEARTAISERFPLPACKYAEPHGKRADTQTLIVGLTCISTSPRSRDRRAEVGLAAVEHAVLCDRKDA